MRKIANRLHVLWRACNRSTATRTVPDQVLFDVTCFVTHCTTICLITQNPATDYYYYNSFLLLVEYYYDYYHH
jgi:hypothetical protein